MDRDVLLFNRCLEGMKLINGAFEGDFALPLECRAPFGRLGHFVYLLMS